MSGYLQRLLDRAAMAPVAPVVAGTQDALPAGLSQSPVAAMDQRLSDPDFADREAGEFGEPRDVEQPDVANIGGVAQQIREAPQPVDAQAPQQMQMAEAAERIDAPRRGQTREPEQQPVPKADPIDVSAEHPLPVGQVQSEDLVLPDEPPKDAIHSADPPEPKPAKPVEHAPPQAVAVEANEATADNHAIAEPPSAKSQPDTTRPERTPIEVPQADIIDRAVEPAPINRPDPVADTPLVTAETAQTQTPAPVQLAEPPKIVVPPLPEAAPQPQPVQSTAPASTPNSIEKPADPVAPPAPPSARTNRPMTAADASIIGPLPQRRRALTLFGNRRR